MGEGHFHPPAADAVSQGWSQTLLPPELAHLGVGVQMGCSEPTPPAVSLLETRVGELWVYNDLGPRDKACGSHLARVPHLPKSLILTGIQELFLGGGVWPYHGTCWMSQSRSLFKKSRNETS